LEEIQHQSFFRHEHKNRKHVNSNPTRRRNGKMAVRISLLLSFSLSFFFFLRVDSNETLSICDSIQEIDRRYIAIGDIHGSWETFQKILIETKIINNTSCEWLPQSQSVILIQMGDVVDRGSGATESWKCLEQLQLTTPQNCQMVRLIGNHELMWLLGSFRDAHKADTKEKRLALVDSLKLGIQESKIVGSYFTTVNHIPLMFIHAGFRPQMIDYIAKTFEITPTPGELSSFVNSHVRASIQHCMKSGAPCNLNSEVFGAGSERGGRGIGGPFWTDYRVLAKSASEPNFLPNMIQVTTALSLSHPSLISSLDRRSYSKPWEYSCLSTSLSDLY
jgi:hypothetical protein